MSMALEAAALAVEPLVDYAQGRCDWSQAQQTMAAAAQRKFGRRLGWALACQHLLLAPWFRRPLEILSQQQLLPFHTLFTLTRR